MTPVSARALTAELGSEDGAWAGPARLGGRAGVALLDFIDMKR